MSDIVDCHSGFRYAERPTSFQYMGQFHQIHAILSESKTENGYQFIVLAETRHQYQLVYEELHDAWQINPIIN